VLFAPWNWDNIKILIYWFLGTTPIAALGLTWLYENGRFKTLSRVGFFIIMFFLIAAGGIDVFKYAIPLLAEWKEFSAEEIKLARRISAETPQDAVFLTAPTFNHPVFMSGRKSLMGYPAHIWSHGYSDAHRREQDVLTMLKGKTNAIALINTYKPSYVTIGPHERRIGVNKAFFDTNYPCTIATENYKIYDLTTRKAKQPLAPPVSNRQNLTDQKYGLRVCYYGNINWEGEPIYEEILESIEFNWSNEGEKPVPSPFSAILKGSIDIDTAGKYTFKITSDDGSWLYIDDILVIDNGGSHPIKSETGTLALEKGAHKITIKYFDRGGGAVLNLSWFPPGGVESGIPVESLTIKD
jgi:fibro-slime domain-containing protein